MNLRSNKIFSYLFIFLFWLISINMMSLIVIVSIKAFLSTADYDPSIFNNPITAYWVSPKALLESAIFSLLLSILFILVNELSERRKWERLSFGRIIFIKSSVYLLGLLAITALTYVILVAIGTYPVESFGDVPITTPMIWGVTIFLVTIIALLVLLNFIVQTSKMIGNFNVKSFFTGKYHEPVREDRIFLFLDLTSSTSYAEKLGSYQYSKLIKDCLDDINYLVERFRAEIYQYVGDEIVLTWRTPEGLHNHNFLAVFFAFRKELNNRKDYYMEQYGIVPDFKAGVNSGPVSVAEVGNIKRDIAFYGDVVNTTSRIQGVCNQFGKKLLVSGQLMEKVNGENGYKVEFLGEHLLRGKHEKVGLYAVEEHH